MSSDIPVLLKIFKPLSYLMPSISEPTHQISFKEKCLWTVFSLVIFLVCCQIPLYGVIRVNSSDPFHWFRMVIASNRGSLMELGITPIVTSSMVVQIMVVSNIVKIDYNDKTQKAIFNSAQKFCAMMAVLFEAQILIRSGIYGSKSDLGVGNSVLILAQLFFAGLVVILLDEMLEKGYGLGSGISLFISTNICERIFWLSFSPTTISTGKGMQFEGAIVEFFRFVFSGKFSLGEFYSMVNRQNLPNIKNLFGTLIVTTVVVYLQDIKTELPLVKKGIKGVYGKFPIKLMPSSTFPIILQSSMVSNLMAVSQALFRFYKNNYFVRLFGIWDYVEGNFVPVGGLSYYFFPVRSLTEAINHPLRFSVYFISVVGLCGVFSVLWLDFSGASPLKIARQLDSQRITFQNRGRSDTVKILRQHINTAAILGGFCIGILTVFADIVGALGSGTGILLVVNLIFGYYKVYVDGLGGVSSC